MSLVTVVSTVIVAVTGPVFWDAAATVTFKLDTGAGMAAACLITVIPAVIVCTQKDFLFSYRIFKKIQFHRKKSQKMITVVTAPVDVDATAIGAGKLSQREAGWVG